jgi:predicted ABC-type ATPase
MPTFHATIYLIAGCNGAGKTTFAKEFLPNEVKCLRFFNADESARGLLPLDPSAGAIKAGRLLLSEIRDSIDRDETFALESTLSGKTYVRIFEGGAFVRLRSGNSTTSGLPMSSRRLRECAVAPDGRT